MDSQPRGDVARFGSADLLGPYQIEELIGVGGMGEIYKAHDTRKSISRTVAIKVLRDSASARQTARERFEREAQIISSFNHPHICTLYDVGEQDGVLFLVMEHLVGVTLAARLAEGPLELNQLLRYATEIADAVATAHARQVIHRDLKPSNVMVTDKGTKLLDFGIAKFFSGSELSTITGNITVDGALVGTLRYMAPEVLSGEEVDSRADIFAFGCVLYEMAAGRPAFEGETPAAIVNAILHHEPPAAGLIRPGVPPALDQIITCCLAKHPDERWQNAADIVHQLKWIADGHLRTPLSDSVLPGPRRGRAKRTVLVLAAVMTAAIAGGLLSIGTAARFEPSPHVTAVPCSGAADLIDETMLCSGLAEDLTRRLSKLTTSQPIQVTTLGESVRRGVRTAATTRPALGATHVLTGMVRQGAAGVEIEYRLLEAKPGASSAEPFTLGVSEVYTSQDRIAAFVIRRLGLKLDHAERDVLVAPQTSSAPAWDSYLRGLGLFRTGLREPSIIDRVLASVSAAVTADATFAEAHALDGFAAWAKFELGKDVAWRDAALAMCDRAVTADAALAEAHGCRGRLLHFQGKHREAAIALKTAVAADPTYDDAIVWLGNEYEEERDFDTAEKTYREAVASRSAYWASHAWLGNYFRRQGRFAEAATEYESVVERIPTCARALAVLAVPMMYTGHYDDALKALERSVAIEPTPEAFANWAMTLVRMRRFAEARNVIGRAPTAGPSRHQDLGNAGRIEHYLGRDGEAAALYRKALALAELELGSPGRKNDLHLAIAEYSVKLGLNDEARTHLRLSQIDPASPIRPSDPHVLFFAAMVYNQLGDRAEALSWLDRAVYWGVPPTELIAFPELDNLRDEPVFKNLVTRK